MSAARTSLILTLTVWLGLGVNLPAQTASTPSPLESLRSEFTSSVLSGSRQITEQYIRALGKLEEELASAGDYEDALAVQKRRDDLTRVLAKSPAPLAAPSIQLTTSAARLTGVTLDEGNLTRWRTTGSHAEWAVKTAPGTYRIEISYVFTAGPDAVAVAAAGAAPPTEARFRFQEVFVLSSTTNFRDLLLARSENLVTYTTVRTEPLTFTKPSFTLRLEALQNYGTEIVRIKDIRLIPEEAAAPVVTVNTPPPSGSGESDLAVLRENFLKEITALRAPILSEYEAKLKTLKAQPDIAKDAELQTLIAAEQKRAIAGTGSVNSKPGSVVKMPGANLDGFEDLNGALWVADPGNTAERFKVSHEGKEFWVRLSWVKCPPPTADDEHELRSAAKAFGIAEDDALAIGRVALEYARGHLEGKPLRLLVRSQRTEKKDAAPALVFLDGLGFFQAMLVDYGLAAYSPPEARTPAQRSLVELAMMRMLKERQDKASAREPAPGAWAFRAAAPSKR